MHTYKYFAGGNGTEFLQCFFQVSAAIDGWQFMYSFSSHQDSYLKEIRKKSNVVDSKLENTEGKD